MRAFVSGLVLFALMGCEPKPKPEKPKLCFYHMMIEASNAPRKVKDEMRKNASKALMRVCLEPPTGDFADTLDRKAIPNCPDCKPEFDLMGRGIMVNWKP